MGTCSFYFLHIFPDFFLFSNPQNQEPYMEGVNPFIKNNKHRMIMFLDELGVSEEIPPSPPPKKPKQISAVILSVAY